MDNYMIIEEYLNHFMCEEELSKYLCIDVDKVYSALDNVEGKIKEEIINHKKNINKYNNKYCDKDVVTDIDVRVLEIASYIIENKSSIRVAATKFKLSKTTVGDYMKKRLPKISIETYKKVFEILQEHKSLNINHKANIEKLDKEIICLNEGMTIDEISEYLNISRNTVQRDLANRTKLVSSSLNRRVKEKLYNNQMRMNRK